MSIVYIIENSKNTKVYIGATQMSLRDRWRLHKSDARNGGQSLLLNAIHSIGEALFTCRVLEEVDGLEKLNERKAFWVEKMNAIENGYNREGSTCVYKKDVKRCGRKGVGPNATLTPKQVRTIRKAAGKVTQAELAKRYKISTASIYKIQKGLNYRNVHD